jgi:peptidoglycan/xylan/chitin deacetylase (PgdA/CDA1 family)
MYHRFGSADQGGDPQLWIEPERFAAQLRWLREHGYRTLTLDEAHEALAKGKPAKRSVLITIDDGFADDLERAADLLEQEGTKAAVFVPTGLLGRSADLHHPTGDATQVSTGTIADVVALRRWLDRGFDVGCHSMTHADLTLCDPDTLHEEVKAARDRMSELLTRPIDDFCYPFAHHDAASRAAVERAGYRAAYAGEPPIDDLYAIPRMMIYPGDHEARFRRKVSGYYFWLSALHRKLRRFVRN